MINYLFIRAVIIISIIAFAKQFPKYLEEMTGLKGGNLKFGIKDKLAAGGVFAAGSLGYAGVKGAIRGFNKTEVPNDIKGFDRFKKKLGGTVGGGFSSQFNALKNGSLKANTFSSGIDAANKGINKAEKTTERYRNNSQNFFTGALADVTADIKSGLGVTKDLSAYTADNEALGEGKKKLDVDKSRIEAAIEKKMKDNDALLSSIGFFERKADGTFKEDSDGNKIPLEGVSISTLENLVNGYKDLVYKPVIEEQINMVQEEVETGILDGNGNMIMKTVEREVKTKVEKAMTITDAFGEVHKIENEIDLANFKKTQDKILFDVNKAATDNYMAAAADNDLDRLAKMIGKTSGADIDDDTLLEAFTLSHNNYVDVSNHMEQNKEKFDKALRNAMESSEALDVKNVKELNAAITSNNALAILKARQKIADAEIARNLVAFEEAKRKDAGKKNGSNS